MLAAVALLAAAAVAPAGAAARRSSSAAGARLLAEKDVNLEQAAHVADLLRARGLQVMTTRTSDVFVPLRTRTSRANDANADAFVSVHNNSSPNPAVNGTEVYAQVGEPGSISLAERILERVSASSGTRARGVFQRRGNEGDYYFVLREAAMRAVIVEGAYLSNAAEAHALSTPDFRRRAAEGIAAGVIAEFDALPGITGGTAPPPLSPAVLPAPVGLTAAVEGRNVQLRWIPAPGATGYRVWRDGKPVADVAGPTGGAFVDSGLPAGDHLYEVRAVVEVAGAVVAESSSTTARALVPWLVVVDAGHGGHDPGAVGRY